MSGVEEVAADTGYTMTDEGDVILQGTVYSVQVQDFAETGGQMVWLTGPKGASYFLRGFLEKDDGLRQVISWKSGSPLHKRGNEVRVYHVGNVIEEATHNTGREARG